jgi:hypothetical protein
MHNNEKYSHTAVANKYYLSNKQDVYCKKSVAHRHRETQKLPAIKQGANALPVMSNKRGSTLAVLKHKKVLFK